MADYLLTLVKNILIWSYKCHIDSYIMTRQFLPSPGIVSDPYKKSELTLTRTVGVINLSQFLRATPEDAVHVRIFSLAVSS